MEWALHCVTGVLIRENEKMEGDLSHRHLWGEGPVNTEEVGGMPPQAKEAWSPLRLEEARREPPLELPERAQHC